MTVASLFGDEQPDAAIAEAEAHADERWFAQALAVVRVLAHRGEPFTTDDVWARLDRMGTSTHEPRAMGAVMRRAKTAGLCQPTDEYRPSVRPEHHRGPVRVWVSTRPGR